MQIEVLEALKILEGKIIQGDKETKEELKKYIDDQTKKKTTKTKKDGD